MHQQEQPGHSTRYSEADCNVYYGVIGVRLPTGAKDPSLNRIYTTPSARLGRKSAASRSNFLSHFLLMFSVWGVETYVTSSHVFMVLHVSTYNSGTDIFFTYVPLGSLFP
jgi:hypothetical protein